MPGKSKFQISRSLDERIKRIIGGSAEQDSEFAQVNTAYILGFNYGNVTNCVGLTTNYQLHHAVFPVVGIVYLKISPTDEDIKSSLKSVKDYSSSPNGLGSFKSDKNEHLFLVYSTTDHSREVERRIFNFTKGQFVRRRRLRLNVLDDPFNPRQVHKGNDEFFKIGDADSLASTDDDQVDHLIFFIHGVGGVCDVRFRSCVEVVADFKKMANNLLIQHSSSPSRASTPSNKQSFQQFKSNVLRKSSSSSGESNSSDAPAQATSKSSITKPRRVECLPISWHSCTRRQTGMNDQLSLIALSSVPKLRHFLNKVVMDALLYCSGPVYNQVIINNVGDEINRLYTLFMEKHPNFNGSVSLAGHSLGSVILFDLLAHQIPLEPEPTDGSLNNSDGDTGSNINTTNTNTVKHDNNNHLPYESQSQEQPKSKRHCCGNISHHHHNPNSISTSSDGTTQCSEYKNLEELLKDMNLTQYTELFQKEHIDIRTLLLLTDLDMKELNLPLGARRKLGTYINFKKVSLAASSQKNIHSAHQSTSESGEPIGSQSATGMENMQTGQYLLKYPQLKFKPRCFFAFGSPMPMFLNVRGVQNISKEYKFPTCDRMFNIFHPYDPLAYRMEPLIDPRFKNVEPVQIPHHRGGKRMHVQLREGFARVGHDIKHRLLGSLRNTWSSFTKFSTTTTEPDEISESGAERGDHATAVREDSLESKQRKLTASSSADVVIESFDSGQSSTSMQKRPLLRQPLVRSQSELNASTLDSIIENSAQSMCEGDEDAESLGGDENDLSLPSASVSPTNNQPSDFSPDLHGIPPPASGGFEKQATRQRKIGSKRNSAPEVLSRKDSSIEFDTSKIGRLNGGRRLDYVLQEKPIELFNEYIFAFTSHANYWQNEDSALIILNEIYQGDNVQIFDQCDLPPAMN